MDADGRKAAGYAGELQGCRDRVHARYAYCSASP